MNDEIVKCKRCGATDLYWITVMGRREAEFISKANKKPLVLKLAKAKLYNVDGSEHVCPIATNNFGPVEE